MKDRSNEAISFFPLDLNFFFFSFPVAAAAVPTEKGPRFAHLLVAVIIKQKNHLATGSPSFFFSRLSPPVDFRLHLTSFSSKEGLLHPGYNLFLYFYKGPAKSQPSRNRSKLRNSSVPEKKSFLARLLLLFSSSRLSKWN